MGLVFGCQGPLPAGGGGQAQAGGVTAEKTSVQPSSGLLSDLPPLTGRVGAAEALALLLRPGAPTLAPPSCLPCKGPLPQFPLHTAGKMWRGLSQSCISKWAAQVCLSQI